MNTIEKLGFANWFKYKVDLTKITGFDIARVISVNKNCQMLERVIVKTKPDEDGDVK